MRVFEKDGDRRTTASPSAAVDLLARGYVEILDDEPRFDTRLPGDVAQSFRDQARTGAATPRSPADERNNAPD